MGAKKEKSKQGKRLHAKVEMGLQFIEGWYNAGREENIMDKQGPETMKW
jgi:hypothetical protein